MVEAYCLLSLPRSLRPKVITVLRDVRIKRPAGNRLFASTVSCTYEAPGPWALETITIADRARLWWDPKQPDQAALWALSMV